MRQTLKNEKEYFIRLTAQFEKELSTLPAGNLHCKSKGPYSMFYLYGETHPDEAHPGEAHPDEAHPDGAHPGRTPEQRYLSLKNAPLIDGLARKRYLLTCLSILKANVKAIDCFLGNYQTYDPLQIFSALPAPLKTRPISRTAAQLTLWAARPYPANPHHRDHLRHTSFGGLPVRSKSEAMIANELELHQLPFRYEEELVLGGKIFYPDFSIRRKKDNKLIYWEHFGMVDNEDYAASMEAKLKCYRDHSLLPWDNLITSFESPQSPLQATAVRSIVACFLL